MNRKYRDAVLALALAFIMLFAVVFIGLEADHDCHGEDCAICAQIQICVESLRLLMLDLAVMTVTAVLRRILSRIQVEHAPVSQQTNLVAWKVKLSD